MYCYNIKHITHYLIQEFLPLQVLQVFLSKIPTAQYIAKKAFLELK